jgi:hypothetical protein
MINQGNEILGNTRAIHFSSFDSRKSRASGSKLFPSLLAGYPGAAFPLPDGNQIVRLDRQKLQNVVLVDADPFLGMVFQIFEALPVGFREFLQTPEDRGGVVLGDLPKKLFAFANCLLMDNGRLIGIQ